MTTRWGGQKGRFAAFLFIKLAVIPNVAQRSEEPPGVRRALGGAQISDIFEMSDICYRHHTSPFSQVRDLQTTRIALQMLASDSKETHRIANARER
jgi:hypothetical protein